MNCFHHLRIAVESIKSLMDLDISWNGLGLVRGGGMTPDPGVDEPSPHRHRGAGAARHAAAKRASAAAAEDIRTLSMRLGSALATNKTLLHLDMGGNKFSTRDLCELALGLCANQTVVRKRSKQASQRQCFALLYFAFLCFGGWGMGNCLLLLLHQQLAPRIMCICLLYTSPSPRDRG